MEDTRYPHNSVKDKVANYGGSSRTVLSAEGGKSAGDLKVLYTNADSLLNKRVELDALIDIHNPSIIGIVEVKPKNSRYEVQECEIGIKGYQTFHNLNGDGRGVCLHVHLICIATGNMFGLYGEFHENIIFARLFSSRITSIYRINNTINVELDIVLNI